MLAVSNISFRHDLITNKNQQRPAAINFRLTSDTVSFTAGSTRYMTGREFREEREKALENFFGVGPILHCGNSSEIFISQNAVEPCEQIDLDDIRDGVGRKLDNMFKKLKKFTNKEQLNACLDEAYKHSLLYNGGEQEKPISVSFIDNGNGGKLLSINTGWLERRNCIHKSKFSEQMWAVLQKVIKEDTGNAIASGNPDHFTDVGGYCIRLIKKGGESYLKIRKLKPLV